MIFAFRGVKVSVLGYPTPLQDCNFLRGSFPCLLLVLDCVFTFPWEISWYTLFKMEMEFIFSLVLDMLINYSTNIHLVLPFHSVSCEEKLGLFFYCLVLLFLLSSVSFQATCVLWRTLKQNLWFLYLFFVIFLSLDLNLFNVFGIFWICIMIYFDQLKNPFFYSSWL